MVVVAAAEAEAVAGVELLQVHRYSLVFAVEIRIENIDFVVVVVAVVVAVVVVVERKELVRSFQLVVRMTVAT